MSQAGSGLCDVGGLRPGSHTTDGVRSEREQLCILGVSWAPRAPWSPIPGHTCPPGVLSPPTLPWAAPRGPEVGLTAFRKMPTMEDTGRQCPEDPIA